MKYLLIFVYVAFLAHQSLASYSPADEDYIKQHNPFEGLGPNLYKDHENLKYIDFKKCGREIYNSFPWITMIVHSDTETKEKYSCAGDFISDHVILTTARCVSKRGKFDK
jgi:hypothetical protein